MFWQIQSFGLKGQTFQTDQRQPLGRVERGSGRHWDQAEAATVKPPEGSGNSHSSHCTCRKTTDLQSSRKRKLFLVAFFKKLEVIMRYIFTVISHKSKG